MKYYAPCKDKWILVIVIASLFPKLAESGDSKRELLGVWIKLPPAHLSITHGGGFTLSVYCWTSSKEAVITNFYCHCFDPTGNWTRVYRFSRRRSIQSAIDRFKVKFYVKWKYIYVKSGCSQTHCSGGAQNLTIFKIKNTKNASSRICGLFGLSKRAAFTDHAYFRAEIRLSFDLHALFFAFTLKKISC